MTEYRQKQDMVAENRNSRNPLIIAVGVICALSVLLVVFLACKNPIFYSLAENKAENLEFDEAVELAENVSSEKGDLLSDYLELRLDINANYPMLLSSLDMEKINEWTATAAKISQSNAGLSEKIIADAANIGQKLETVTAGVSGFDAMETDILSLMDIFSEVNRLLTKGTDGKNIPFTVSEERARLAQWQTQVNALSQYSMTVPNNQNIYLLTYLIREAQGEISEITEALDSVVASGYSETDRVRFSGSGRKTFPGVQNDKGESVDFLNKNGYIDFLRQSIERELAESLGEFYIP